LLTLSSSQFDPTEKLAAANAQCLDAGFNPCQRTRCPITPDHVWQDYDKFPNFPALMDFLAFREKSPEGPLFAITVAHSKLIKPAELHAVDGVFRLH
jgi:hypothetical protein